MTAMASLSRRERAGVRGRRSLLRFGRDAWFPLPRPSPEGGGE
jgi:hypothetical protein